MLIQTTRSRVAPEARDVPFEFVLPDGRYEPLTGGNDASETLDTDGDGIGNNADTDDDGDGYPDALSSLQESRRALST